MKQSIKLDGGANAISSTKRTEPDPLDLKYNFLTGNPYSERFYQILEKRKQLPAWEARRNFIKVVKRNQTVILVGETGSGKTTQCPQYLLLAGMNKGRMIACTQPRRVAAMSVAQRVSDEFDVPLGTQIGYTIRYDDKSSDATKLKFCTDGMLLREALSDPLLSRYSIILLDEAHERTMQTDILFGLIKEILKKRTDLKLIIMSATLDSDKFQTYFNNAPIITIPGRTHPVEIFYTPKPESDYVEAAVRTCLQIHTTEEAGDILLFLTGEEEIETVCTRLREESNSYGRSVGDLLCLPLYSSLPPQVQQRVFEKTPPHTRKVVVSTNVAETSITIDGIVYVVDPGYSKQKVYNARKMVESLLVSPISQASAAQRSGRAGRTRPGKCFRLYPESAFKSLDIQTIPEMVRSGLNNMVITLLKLGIDDLVHFDYLEPPAPETLMRSLSQLHKLEVIHGEDGTLTPLGETMAELPLDPMQARMTLQSFKFACVSEILSIAAMLSCPTPFMRPRNAAAEADRAKESFAHQDGDHLTLLNVFHAYLHVEQSGSDVKRWCWENFVQERSMQLAVNVRRQLEEAIKRAGIEIISTPHDHKNYYINIRKAILNGFFQQIAFLKDRQGRYQIAERTPKETVLVHPSSVLKYTPEFLVYHEFALTSMQYIRTSTPVKGEWLLEIAPHHFTINAPKDDDENYWDEGPMKKRLLEIQNQSTYGKK